MMRTDSETPRLAMMVARSSLAFLLALSPMRSLQAMPGCQFAGLECLDFECETCPCPPEGGGGSGGSGAGSGCAGCKVAMPFGQKPANPAVLRGVSGMPVWRVSPRFISVWIDDIPLGYSPAYGPPVTFQLSYGQRSQAGLGTDVFSVGYRWNCSWLSSITPGPTGAGYDNYSLPSGGHRGITACVVAPCPADYYTQRRLGRPSVANDPYTVDYPDGTRDTYGFYVVNSSSQVLAVFLSKRTDPHGQSLYFGYAACDPAAPVARLLTVTDAEGRVTTINYATNHPYSTNLISTVVDPFGRTTTLAYDETGLLTNITDVAGLSSSFAYDEYDWITNMTTPYGQTRFKMTSDGTAPAVRSVLVTQPNGGKELFLSKNQAAGVPSYYDPIPATSPFGNTLDNTEMENRNTFHWSALQYQSLSGTFRSSEELSDLSEADFRIAHLRHWLKNADGNWGKTLSFERLPSPDGTTEGQKIWYDYAGKSLTDTEGTQIMPLLTAYLLLNGDTYFARTERNVWNHETNRISTYSKSDGSIGLRTNTFAYAANSIDLVQMVGPNNEQVVSNWFNNVYHQPDASHDALNQQTRYTYNGQRQVTSIVQPAGLTTTNLYFSSGTYAGWLDKTIDLEIARTNAYSYANGLPLTHTDERGLTLTFFWDNLQRLTGVSYPGGTSTTNIYDKLDLVRTVDRMGYTNRYGYNAIRQMTAHTNANGIVTAYGYCECGALNYVTNGWNTSAQEVTSFTYDIQGNQLITFRPDVWITNAYSALGQLTSTDDGTGRRWFYYNHQGLLTTVSNVAGVEQRAVFDNEDRALWLTDANGVASTNSYDALGRLLTHVQTGGITNAYGYTANVAAMTSHTNPIGKITRFVYDAAGRQLYETNANLEITRYAYDHSGSLTNFVDGKNQTTSWRHDEYGQVTNKYDQLNVSILQYTYDANSRLATRWSAQKGTTTYNYDREGNLTNINYAASTDVTLKYDPLNRLTNMVDAAGTSTFTWFPGGQMATEDGPWASDTVSFGYSNRIRIDLQLQQPTGLWTNRYAYDLARRPTNLISRAGSLSFAYDTNAGTASPLIRKLTTPSGAYITNDFDPAGRLLFTRMLTSGGVMTNKHEYLYNAASQRTNQTRYDNSTVRYTYDDISQLKTGSPTNSGGSWLSSEQRGYTYDTAWNLVRRTNGTTTQTFVVNGKNEMTNAAGTVSTYDANGNMITRGNVTFSWDDENRLTQAINNVTGQKFKTVLTYDGLNRLRKRQEYHWADPPEAPSFGPRLNGPGGGGGGSFELTSETRYVYDGKLVIQERDENNTPLVSYTRGNDLSGSREGAGGIGGLLARSHGYSSGNWSTHNYYHADGNGNVTFLLATNQTLAARYVFDPYGREVSKSGILAGENLYRFSSKEFHDATGFYYYLYRWYAPEMQRWGSRDPLSEKGFVLTHGNSAVVDFLNSYMFVANEPVRGVDAFGLQKISIFFPPSLGGNSLKCMLISRTDPITGDPTPGKGNHNGESACIWRCNSFGDQPPLGGPSTTVTFAKSNKPCPPPIDYGCGRKASVVTGDLPPYMKKWFEVPVYE